MPLQVVVCLTHIARLSLCLSFECYYWSCKFRAIVLNTYPDYFLNKYNSGFYMKNLCKNTTLLNSLCALVLMLAASIASAETNYIQEENQGEAFPLVVKGKAAQLYLSADDYAGVLKVAAHLQADIKSVTGKEPEVVIDKTPESGPVVLIGTLGKSPLIDKLARENKINAEAVAGHWDTFALQTVESPLPGVDQALVIFGADKRGTIYGMYDLATQAGVSPWYWWADVPVQKKKTLYVARGFHSPGEPKIKYRGIFINDEAPALRNWAEDTFGGFNHQFYEKVYELILRNKGNYLWPAMWQPSAIYVDDPESPRLADEMGVVIATTHHEPMMRAHAEWGHEDRGAWNYNTNADALKEFWRGGVERMGDYESVVTVGMRGDGDEAMSEDTAVDLMKKIIEDQRDIIAEVTGKPAAETPQVWALYKEVQDYYDKGMRVADDVTILLCDDNWGNVRILPKKEDLKHEGGFGIYYHFDFVGGPVSYRWLNVTQIERVWEQMKLSYDWGARELWLVNVGDIKPMELPTSFFLDFAWNPEAITAQDLPNYYVNWASQQFGESHAEEIADILALTTKYSARRTPEMLKPDTYSLKHYREAESMLADYQQLVSRAKTVYKQLPKNQKSAFYQLVLFPAEISSNLNEMYVAAGKNLMYGEQGRSSANYYANKTKELFDKDAELISYYHNKMAGGKWNHIMSQTHIGYTSWNNPPVNKMPAVSYVQIEREQGMGINIEHAERRSNALPQFDNINKQQYAIEIFNLGNKKLNYSLTTDKNWIQLSSQAGSTEREARVMVSIDWNKAPKGKANGKVTISGAGEQRDVQVAIRNEASKAKGFIENNGVVAIEAANYTRAVAATDVNWQTIPNLGRTHSAVSVTPSNAERRQPGKNAPYLEYTFTTFTETELAVEAYLSPTLNYKKNEGLLFAIAIDNAAPKIINIHEGETQPDWEYPDWWNNSVTDHIKKKRSTHGSIKPGVHTLKVWMVDPGVVFQKFVIDVGGLKPSYLGPPESVLAKHDK